MSSAPRVPSLDGLRALSILLVIVDHLGRGDAPYQGAFGVCIFFVISGYIITRLLQQEQQRQGRISLRGFYLRRTFRIFPAAFTFITVAGLLGHAAVRRDWPYAFSYTMCYRFEQCSGTFRHLWSLSVEEQFYLLWPLALVFAFRRRGRVAIATMVAAALFRVGCSIVGPQQMPLILHFCFPAVMDSIAAGCLLAVYEPQVRRYTGGLARYRVTAPALLALAYLSARLLWSGSFPDQARIVRYAWAWGLVPMLIAAFIFIEIERRDWIFNNSIAYGLGALSYSLYLWQQPFTLARNGSTLIALLLLLVCAGSSYFVIERPMIALGRRLQTSYFYEPPSRDSGPALSCPTTLEPLSPVLLGAAPTNRIYSSRKGSREDSI